MANPSPPPIKMSISEIEKTIVNHFFNHVDVNGLHAAIGETELFIDLKENLNGQITQGRFDIALRNISNRGEIVNVEGLLRLDPNYFERLVEEEIPF